MRYALVLLLVAIPLSACGGVSLDPVAKAADKTSAKGSEHVSFTGTVTTAGRTIQMNGGGDFQRDPKLGQMHLAMSVGGKQISMDEVMQGWTIYMRSPLFASLLPAGKSWISLDLQQAGKQLGVNFSQFTQQSPTDTLKALEQAGSVKKIGTETIVGQETTHYRATIDLSKAPNGQKLQQLAHMQAAPIDVWIGSDGLLRRMTMNYSETVSGNTVATRMQMDLSNYGEQVNVQVPAASDAVDMTKLGGNG